MQHDTVAANDVFGLAGTFPRPGWVALDAARDRRATGELYLESGPAVRVYFDRGQIYLAERVTDPSLGARLVDAGALTAVQLERGAVRIGEIEHLGHLFERVPNLDRHTVLVTSELMTEECVGWVAAQRVADATWTPYRHHASGMHRWSRGWLEPGEPLPAPSVGEAPISLAPPVPSDHRIDERVADHTERFLDGLIEWDEPSWLDGARLELEEQRGLGAASVTASEPMDHDESATTTTTTAPGSTDLPGGADGGPVLSDWVDLLATDGLPDEDPLGSSTRLPRLPIEPVERFELVWPSGEIDEEFGAVDSVAGNGHDPDADRVGATARLGRPAPESAIPEQPIDVAPTELDRRHVVGGQGHAGAPEHAPDSEDTSDDVVLAVRRAVASIDVGSLAARQRLADRHDQLGQEPADDGSVAAPGRVAVRSGRNDWSRRTVTRSVFDEPVVQPPVAAPEPSTGQADDHRDRRAGALRRLISSLRR